MPDHLDHSSRPDMMLVAMPFMLIRWPCLPLGLLKAILNRRGLTCEVIYAHLIYADQVGLNTFLLAEGGWNHTYLGDWLFQQSLFPGQAMSASDYLEGYLPGGRNLTEQQRKQAIVILTVMRARSEAFLDDLVAAIIHRRPKIVGCSLTVVQLFACLALFRRIKAEAPDILTLAGGPACEAAPGMALHRAFPQIDYLFSGDADHCIAEICHFLSNANTDPIPSIPVGLLTPEHRVQGYPAQAPRAIFDALDDNPMPDLSDFFDTLAGLPALRDRIQPALVVEGSRGCWYGERSLCNFCGDCGVYPKYRFKSGPKLFEEMQALWKAHGISRFVFTDNVLNPRLFQSLFPKLRPNPWSLFIEIRSGLPKPAIAALRQAGIDYTQAGIESLHTDALAKMNKGVQSWQNIQCLKWCRQYGIHVVWFILTHFPDEDDAWNLEQAELTALLTHLQPPRFVGIIRPDRHSPYYLGGMQTSMVIVPKESYLRLFGDRSAQARQFAFHLQDRRVTDLLADPIEHLVRPGFKMLKRAIARWQRAFMQSDPPHLEMRQKGNRTILVDSRSAFGPVEYALSDPEKAMLDITDAAPLESEMLAICRRNGLESTVVECHLKQLMDSGLIISRDGRLISLVLNTPVKNLPQEDQLPIGCIAGEQNVQASDPLSCKIFWKQGPLSTG